MIEFEKLERMFEAMRRDARWDVDGVLRWGYLFYDADRRRLGALSETLEGMGYRMTELGPTEDEDAAGLCMLRVERDEHHDPQSLHQRNRELSALAARFGVAEYDGMDVAPLGRVIAQA